MTIRRARNVSEQRTAQAMEQRANLVGWPNGWGWNDPSAIPPPGLFNQQRAGVPVTVHTSLQIDTVFTSLRVISNSIIKMGNPIAYTLGYTDTADPYRVTQNTQPQILTNTFGQMFQYDGVSRTVVSMGLFGEAFWLTLTRNALQYPTSIEVLNPAFVHVDRDDNSNSPTYGQPVYWYGSGINRKQLPTVDVTHIPFMALPGARRALSSIEYGGVSFALALAAVEYGSRWFAQGASPSYLLSTEGKMADEEIERIADKFMVEHAGLQAAHLPLVVDNGLKVQKIQSTPDEAQYLGTLDAARKSIAAWFGLPPHLVGSGDMGNVWGKTVQEQGIQLVDFTLSGYTIRLNEAFSSLLPKGVYAALDESQIARADSTMVAQEVMANRTTGVETPNEIRVRVLRRAPKNGGDDLLTPLNSNTVPQVGQIMGEVAAKEAGEPAPPPMPAPGAPPAAPAKPAPGAPPAPANSQGS